MMALSKPDTGEYLKVEGVDLGLKKMRVKKYMNAQHRQNGDNMYLRSISHMIDIPKEALPKPADPSQPLEVADVIKKNCYVILKETDEYKTWSDC